MDQKLGQENRTVVEEAVNGGSTVFLPPWPRLGAIVRWNAGKVCCPLPPPPPRPQKRETFYIWMLLWFWKACWQYLFVYLFLNLVPDPVCDQHMTKFYGERDLMKMAARQFSEICTGNLWLRLATSCRFFAVADQGQWWKISYRLQYIQRLTGDVWWPTLSLPMK